MGRALSLPPGEGRPLAFSLRGQALQGKQKSVVSTVPNPKWLRPSLNPIKARLVYLSSSGLFITVQMVPPWEGSAAPCQPPATQSSAQQNPGLHLRGATRGGHPGTRRPSLPPLCAHPSLVLQHHQWGRERAPLCQAGPGPATPGVEPLITTHGRCSWEGRGSGEGPRWGAAGVEGGRLQSMQHPSPTPGRRPNKGASWGAAGGSGRKVKPEQIKGEPCRKDSTVQPPGVCVAGEPEELEAASTSLEVDTLLQSRSPAGASQEEVAPEGWGRTPGGSPSLREPLCPHLKPTWSWD